MNNKNRILKKNQLSKLVNRFSKSYVIEEMQRNLQQAKSTELLTSNIDDNTFLKSAILPNETLKRVADSIFKSGITNPLIVRPKKNYYEIIFGRKRLLACKKYKIERVPARVINVNDEEMLFMLLADARAQRESNIIEIALVLDELSNKYNYDQKTLAELAHQSRSQITNILRLLNLPKHIIDDISVNKLSYGHAKAIASLPEDTIEELVKRIYDEKLSVRAVEYIVKSSRKINKEYPNNLLLNKYQGKIINNDKSITINFINNKDKEDFLKDIKK